MSPVHIPSTHGYDADLAAVARVAEVDPADVVGWAMVVLLPGGQVSLSHNACCTAHARDQVVWLLNHMPATLVECSGELYARGAWPRGLSAGCPLARSPSGPGAITISDDVGEGGPCLCQTGRPRCTGTGTPGYWTPLETL